VCVNSANVGATGSAFF